MSGERIKGESDLAYQYFQIFRDLPPAERNLRELCRHEVGGKKRTHRVFDRWSSNYDWVKRINQWDRDRASDAMASIILRRNADIEKFVDSTFTVMTAAQTIVTKKMVKMSKEKDPSAVEFRTVMMGYTPVREWLKDLIGFLDKATDDAVRTRD